MPEITHILKYRAYWCYMGFCPKISDWQWIEENTIYRVPLDMREATIIMQDLVVGITGGFIDE